MTSVTLEEAEKNFAQLIQEARRGEEIVITEADRPIVRLLPAFPVRPRAQFGSARGKIEITEDFDAPLDDFKEYMG